MRGTPPAGSGRGATMPPGFDKLPPGFLLLFPLAIVALALPSALSFLDTSQTRAILSSTPVADASARAATATPGAPPTREPTGAAAAIAPGAPGPTVPAANAAA